jgi:hypothetical protein
MTPAVLLAGILLRHSSGAAARPLIDSAVSIGRNLTNIAPGCTQDCCYDPDWWLNTRPAPIVTCLDGDSTGFDAEGLAQACNDGVFPGEDNCITTGTGATICGNQSGAKCNFVEATGSNVDASMMPCTTQEWNGQTFTVYDGVNIKGGNNEITWQCADSPQGGPAGTSACNQPNSQTYNNGASYAKTSGWNVGGSFETKAKLFDVITSGFTVTGGYSRSTTSTTTSSVTVTAKPGEHACVTKGTLVHHGWGTMFIESTHGSLLKDDCKKWKVDNWGTDAIITDENNPDYATAQAWGGEVKPCGYPLLSGAT